MIVTSVETGSIGDKILYAKWDLISYSVSFDTQDVAVANPSSQTITYFNGISYPIISKWPKTFMGWFDNREGIGDPYDFENTISEDIVLYAKWSDINSLSFPYEAHNVGLQRIFWFQRYKRVYVL